MLTVSTVAQGMSPPVSVAQFDRGSSRRVVIAFPRWHNRGVTGHLYCFPSGRSNRPLTRRYWVSNKSPNTKLTCGSWRKAERRSESTYLQYGDRLSTLARFNARSCRILHKIQQPLREA